MTKHTKVPLTVTSLAELLARPIAEPPDLLGGWLYAGETAMLWAAPGVGKSMFSLTVALAVAGGGSFLGLKAPAARRVLFIDGEMTALRIKARAKALVEGIDGLDSEAAGQNLQWFARKDQRPGAVFPDIATPEGRAEVLKLANKSKPALVVLDNFQSLASVEDENVTTAFNETERLMMELQRIGAATLMVHHSGKTGATYRGTSKIGGVFDSVVGLKRLEDAPPGQAGFSIGVEKDRNGGTANSLPPAAVLEGEGACSATRRWVVREDDAGLTERIVRLVESGRFASQADIVRHLEGTGQPLHKATVSRALKKAEASGRLRKEAQKTYFEAAQEEPDEASLGF